MLYVGVEVEVGKVDICVFGDDFDVGIYFFGLFSCVVIIGLFMMVDLVNLIMS